MTVPDVLLALFRASLLLLPLTIARRLVLLITEDVDTRPRKRFECGADVRAFL